MLGVHNQVWVTSALCDEDVSKALTLSFSLRRTYTTRKIAVIVSTKIAPDLRQALHHGFDIVFYLDETYNTAGLNPTDFAMVFSLLALQAFETCAYVSPSMMALKNCDAIFANCDDALIFLGDSKNTSIFLFQPLVERFEALMSWLDNFTKNGHIDIGRLLRNWAKNQFTSVNTIPAKFCKTISREEGLLGYEDDISMVNFLDYPSKSNTANPKSTGVLENLATTYCLKILSEKVTPLINQLTSVSHQKVNRILPKSGASYPKEPIAIVGMSCRYPGSNNLEEFWNLLVQREDGTCNPPSFRWLREQCSIHQRDARKTNAGFLKVPVDEFDSKFFGISPMEVLNMDPQHRLLHELIWEALEDACLNPQALRGTSGSVFMGSWLNDYKDILLKTGKAEFYRTYMGNSIGAAAARISFMLGITGPSIATESGCSSAIVTVHLACKALQNGETNMALACGVNMLLHQFNKDAMPMMISPDGHCKTFSEDADGFARAEGGGVLVLKRLSDAVNDGDHIWGLIRGSAMTQEGVSKSMGTPTIQCESLAMEEALRDAKVAPHEVSYVEAHGTGTVVGDPMEVAAIAKAYNTPKRKDPLVIGSVKTNVGHTESCSGITGIMKVILAMHHEVIPAHRNFTNLNPSIDLNAVPAVIPLEPMEWKKVSGRPRLAGVSSFGITGTDAHVIIEESPELQYSKVLAMNDTMERPLHIFKLSAKTEEAMGILMEKFKETLQACDHSIADIAFSANVGRADFPIRAAVVAKSKDDIYSAIEHQNFIKGESNSENLGKICFLFTGQGSQYPGMAKKLYESSPVFRMHFDHCTKLLREKYNICIQDVLWSNKPEMCSQISRTIYSQTSIFCVEYALLKLWESWGVKPDYVLGHSLGEFSAAVCAGILTLEDGIMLVAERSKLIDGLPSGKMLVIKADYQQVEKKMKQFAGEDSGKMLDFAAINCSTQTVVAGDPDVVLGFCKFCTESGMKCTVLEASHAFHSKHMDPMLEEYRKVAKTTAKSEMYKCDFISGMKGDLIDCASVDSNYWVQHTREKVNFLSASKNAVELGCRIFIEIGPQPVLSALTMMNDDTNLLCLPSLKKNEDEWSTLLTSLAKLYVEGFDIDWKGFDQFYKRSKVRLPHYPFIGKKFWPDLIHTSENIIHPLLGSPIPNASSTKIFQNGVNLKNHEYIMDHVMGQTVLFPGACFMETCLAAGLATVEGSTDSLSKPSRPMKLENFSIKAPLALDDSKTVQIQTVVELNKSTENEHDWNDLSVKFYHRVESEFEIKWLEHAQATFSPLPTAEDQMIPVNIKKQFHDTLASPSDPEEEISRVYQRLASVGLNFGAHFRSIEKRWRREDGTTLVKVKFPSDTESQSTPHIIHPVLVDSMIQAIMLQKKEAILKKKLYVPISIGKFVWLSNGLDDSKERFIHVFDKPGQNFSTALLLDSNGTVLAVMSNVEFFDTTVKTLEAVLEQQISTLPQMWEETWRPQAGPLEFNHEPIDCGKKKFYNDQFYKSIVQKYDKISPYLQHVFGNLEKLVYLNILRSLFQCGFQPSLNSKFDEQTLRQELKIEKTFEKMFGYFLRILEEENLLKSDGTGKWHVVKTFPTLEQLNLELSSTTFTEDLVKSFNPTRLFIKLGENLSKILQGQQSALGYLFPEEGDKSEFSSASEFYSEYGKLFGLSAMIGEVNEAAFKNCKDHSKGKKTVIRICEIGAGTGVFTKTVLEVLTSLGIEFEYTYTDISTAFFPAAEKRFEKHLKQMTFKKLNIEEDPLSQGFVPAFYDHVIASDVIHATKNLKETLSNVRLLLKPGGGFDMFEMTRVNRIITYLFGMLEGFWRFEDVDVRQNHCTLTTEGWTGALESAGFKIVGSFPGANQHHSLICSRRRVNELNYATSSKMKSWIIFHEESSHVSDSLLSKFSRLTNRKRIVVRPGSKYQKFGYGDSIKFYVRIDSGTDFAEMMKEIENSTGSDLEGILYCWPLQNENLAPDQILKPVFHLAKAIQNLKSSSGLKLIVITKGTAPLQDSDMSGYYQSVLCGFLKSFQNESLDLNCRWIDIGDNESESGTQQIFYEVWNPGKDAQVAFQGSTRFTPKIAPLKPSLEKLSLPPGSDRFQLILPETKSISDLKFGHLEQHVLEEGEVEIQLKCSALNFRDIFSVLKPSEFFKNVNSVGFDFAGVVKRVHPMVTKWQVGDPVFGVNVHLTALPNHVKLHEDDVIPIPDDMTFSEACTLPAVVATSYYCLMDIAKIKKTDVVLIHTASGGVGLSAIEICKHVGATIIATAGSKRKRNYLKSLGIKHIFHSRNTDYADQILEVTNGRGVDVVLNSLTSEGFKEATLKACAPEARFVEMSKLSIWKPEEVNKLRPDVQYSVVDLSALNVLEWRRLMKALQDLSQKKVINPIPYVRFDALQIREALQYMQSAKHIGKIVCFMPEVSQEDGNTKVRTPLFNSRSTYLITGGLGGIGFEVCKWMVKNGAKCILLAGRRPPSQTARDAIDTLNAEHFSKIQAVQLDVSNFNQCKNLIHRKIGEMGYPTLRGIMHAAGTLHDGLIENQSWDTLSSTFGPKIKGTMNLHKLTRSNSKLEHFVLFSSFAATLGAPGQSNHATGNQFEDIFAHYRNWMGLPSTTVNWGQWGEVGIATELDLPGIKPFSTRQALSGLEYAMKSHRTQTAVLNIESFVMLSKLYPYISSYLDERVWKSVTAASTSGQVTLKSDEFWQRYDNLGNVEEKLNFTKEKCRLILRNILKLEESDRVDDETGFQEMGLDSLMFIEIKNSIQSLLGDRIAVQASVLRDCNSIKVLSGTLVGLIEGSEICEKNIIPTAEELNQLIKEDCILPKQIRASSNQRQLEVGEISCALVTGVTGTLGPYVLRELCSRSQMTQITCLIRPSRNSTPEQRLASVLKERDIISEVDLTKIRCVAGDVASPRMGMEPEIWEELLNSVEAVFHCAARVTHLEIYGKQEDQNSTRSVNIGGLKNVLEFCSSGEKLKHIYNASTLLALSTLNEKGNFSESWPHSEDYDGVTNFAYPITKFVGDVLMKEAVTSRGIPGKVFRFPFISGDSRTGRFVMDQNHFMLRYIFTLKTGVMASNPFPLIMFPVDICAKLSVDLFFNPEAPDDIYNIINSKPDIDQDFVAVAKRLGYDVKIVDFAEYSKKVQDEIAENSAMALFKEFYTTENDIMDVYMTTPALQQWVIEGAMREDFFRSKKLEKLIPGFYSSSHGQSSTMEYVYNDLIFAKQHGWLQKFGL